MSINRSAEKVALDLLFIVDPLPTLLAHHDTSVALMEAAQDRGHSVWVTTIDKLEIDGGRPATLAERVDITPAILFDGTWNAAPNWFEVAETAWRDVNSFSVVFVRTDPPVDADYLRMTFVLDLVDARTTLVMNRPEGLRSANEKLFALRCAELGPATLVSSDPQRIVNRVDEWGQAVLKPTDAMAGRGIIILTPGDRNLRSLVESATERGRHHVVLQRWAPHAEHGDRRVIVLAGEPIGVVRRVAGSTDFRCNMATGAVPVADEVNERDREICAALAPHLRALGLTFVGIDVIGGLLTEVNVTSPTGIREIDALSGVRLGARIVEWAELAVSLRTAEVTP